MLTFGSIIICCGLWRIAALGAEVSNEFIKQVVILSLAVASISFTFSETSLFTGIREWVKNWNPWLGKLINCGYCMGHWAAFGLVAIYQPRLFEQWWLLDYFLTALVIAWLAAFQWALLCWLMEKTGK